MIGDSCVHYSLNIIVHLVNIGKMCSFNTHPGNHRHQTSSRPVPHSQPNTAAV